MCEKAWACRLFIRYLQIQGCVCVCICACVCVCVSVLCASVCLSVCLYVCVQLCVCMCVWKGMSMSLSSPAIGDLKVCLSVCLSVCCVSIYCIPIQFVRHESLVRDGFVEFQVLQCVAVCCSVLQCVAVCCSVLQCVIVSNCGGDHVQNSGVERPKKSQRRPNQN